MNFYEQEMRRYFSECDTIGEQKYYGKTLLGKLDGDLRVKLQLVSTRVAEQYNAIRAEIINRTEGLVDSQTFTFEDILGENPCYQSNPMARDIHIWEYNRKADWYGYHPTLAGRDAISDTIGAYLSMYQSEDMSMTL